MSQVRIHANADPMKLDESGRVVGFGEFPVLRTKRLVMRMLTLDDAEFYLRNFSDSFTVELTTFEAPKDIEAAKAEIQEYCIDNFTKDMGIRWGLELKKEGKLAGTCGFFKWDKQNRHAEIGYELLPEYRRQGLMREALTAMIDFSFKEARLNRLYAFIDPRNESSMGLVKSLGFIKEGVFRESTFFRERFYDDVIYAIIARDWMPR